MDLVVRFWDMKVNEVATRYLSSVFLSSVNAKELRKGLVDISGEQILRKTIQISMDEPNVNVSMINGLKKEIEEKYPENPKLLDLGSCGLHTVHGVLRASMKNIGWKIDQFLTCLYRLFKNVPARRGDYILITNSAKFPLKFFDIRWVENTPFAKRAVDVLPSVEICVKKVQKEGGKNPLKNDNRNFQIVSEFLRDPLLRAKLFFFSIRSIYGRTCSYEVSIGLSVDSLFVCRVNVHDHHHNGAFHQTNNFGRIWDSLKSGSIRCERFTSSFRC